MGIVGNNNKSQENSVQEKLAEKNKVDTNELIMEANTDTDELSKVNKIQEKPEEKNDEMEQNKNGESTTEPLSAGDIAKDNDASHPPASSSFQSSFEESVLLATA